jgi:hypothetical protein
MATADIIAVQVFNDEIEILKIQSSYESAVMELIESMDNEQITTTNGLLEHLRENNIIFDKIDIWKANINENGIKFKKLK